MSDTPSLPNIVPLLEALKASTELKEQFVRTFGHVPPRLTDREKNARADALLWHGWDETRCRICGWPLSETVDQGCVAGNCSMRPVPARRADEPTNYGADYAALSELEALIERRNVQTAYLEHLLGFSGDWYLEPVSWDAIWKRVIRAELSARRDAALKALGVDL